MHQYYCKHFNNRNDQTFFFTKSLTNLPTISQINHEDKNEEETSLRYLEWRLAMEEGNTWGISLKTMTDPNSEIMGKTEIKLFALCDIQ